MSLEMLATGVAIEIETIWRTHLAVGLTGHMCLYTRDDQLPFRSREPGVKIWFGPGEIVSAVQQVMSYYNQGNLPNSALLLNPVVHARQDDGSYMPLGSGIIWSTSLCLGIDALQDDSIDRVISAGAFAFPYQRGDNERAGLKIVAIADKAQPPVEPGAVAGCRELYDLAGINSPDYAAHYLLSGLSYLTNNGLFSHPSFERLFPENALSTPKAREKTMQEATIDVQRVLDSAYCWNAYGRHHSLYKKFGANPADVERNLEFFNLVAGDAELFDATGPMRKDADEMFDFIVPGLIPRGSVTLLAASGGTGKSSLAHYLCVAASIDYEPGEEPPRWLGQRLAIEKCKGICVYFSGEDGPPIINARASLFDPEGRARRLMFQRTNFGDGVSFAQFLRRLQKIPDVPLMVIDPARKYLTGDEDDAGVVSEFFEAIEEFAIRKNTAVVVVHHLQKGAYPKSAREVLDMLRGSQVFIDRPRVVIGMFRDGPHTIAGLAKNNIPPNLGMVTQERVFARDPKNLRLVWLPGAEGVRGDTLSEEELERLAQEARKEGR